MKRGFTLIELIVVIIIVGILAAIGMTQYSSIVEKARTAEAKVRIGTMRQLAYQYYLENGTTTGMQNNDVGVDATCSSTDYYSYSVSVVSPTWVDVLATRCTSGGKTPNFGTQYVLFLRYHLDTGVSGWRCYYPGDLSACFGYPSGVGGG